MEYLIIILSLLVVSIIIAVFVVIWRDRRDLKLKKVTEELERIDELYIEIQRYKKEMEQMLDAAKKQTGSAVSRIDNQVKQVRDSVAKLERNSHSNNSDNKDAKDSSRGKDGQQQKNSGRGRSRNTNRRPQASPTSSNHKTEQREQQGQREQREQRGQREQREQRGQREQQEQRIDDGEKYSKMMKLAEQGLSNEEIAKKLNLGCKEVELVTQIKRKNIS